MEVTPMPTQNSLVTLACSPHSHSESLGRTNSLSRVLSFNSFRKLKRSSEMGTTRLLRVLVGQNPFFEVHCFETRIVMPSRSMSVHLRAKSSPDLIPVIRAIAQTG